MTRTTVFKFSSAATAESVVKEQSLLFFCSLTRPRIESTIIRSYHWATGIYIHVYIYIHHMTWGFPSVSWSWKEREFAKIGLWKSFLQLTPTYWNINDLHYMQQTQIVLMTCRNEIYIGKSRSFQKAEIVINAFYIIRLQQIKFTFTCRFQDLTVLEKFTRNPTLLKEICLICCFTAYLRYIQS